MKIIIVHADISEDSGEDEQDVLVQAESVSGALIDLGHEILQLPVTLDLQKLERDLAREKPDLVFNLVESLDGTGRFLHFVPSLLEHVSIPFTGSGSESLYITTGKMLAKERLRYAGIPTPDWRTEIVEGVQEAEFMTPYIVKPAWEDASVGLDDTSIVRTGEELAEILRKRTERYGNCFIESYIDGREFNISLLADGSGGVQILPPAEILFDTFPADKPKIVGYEAKWKSDSFEYNNTPRTFDFPETDAALRDHLTDLSRHCWDAFDLQGYARIDFRVDRDSNPWVIEINANPCISPDAGFTAAAERAGIRYTQMIQRIIESALVS
jgi:D-alanine-D-alanine ligase